MIFVRGNRICETTSTTGVGPYALDGAVIGYFPFSSKCEVGSACEYAVEAIGANGALTGGCEVGIGTFGPGNTLDRTHIYASSNATNPVDWESGVKRISLTLTAEALEGISGLAASANASAASISAINSHLAAIDQFSGPSPGDDDHSNFLTAYQLNN